MTEGKIMMLFAVPLIKSLIAFCGLDKDLKEAKKEIKGLRNVLDDAVRLNAYEQAKCATMNRYITKLLTDNEELIKATEALK